MLKNLKAMYIALVASLYVNYLLIIDKKEMKKDDEI